MNSPRLGLSLTGLFAVASLAGVLFLTAGFGLGSRTELGALRLVVPTVRYGLEVERFAHVDMREAGGALDLRAMLLAASGGNESMATAAAFEATEKAALIDIPGRRTATFRDGTGRALYLAQDINDHEYLRFDLTSGEVVVADRDGIQTEYELSTLFYTGQLDSTLRYAGLPDELDERIRVALRRDLRLDAGFADGILKIVYPVKRDELGEVMGYGPIEALRYRVDGADRTAIRFADDALDVEGFFRPDGKPLQRTWLEAPIAEGDYWISSSFSHRRRHPILKVVKPHYGTDYAAHYGTPVVATSDGLVVSKAATSNNGNFIKIEHDSVYQTQYLHLKGFARGIKIGTRVRKGQVIGYVGSTGLSSGPHVCYRFWKNGRQVNHRRLRLPAAAELSEEAMSAFAQKEAEIQAVFDWRA